MIERGGWRTADHRISAERCNTMRRGRSTSSTQRDGCCGDSGRAQNRTGLPCKASGSSQRIPANQIGKALLTACGLSCSHSNSRLRGEDPASRLGSAGSVDTVRVSQVLLAADGRTRIDANQIACARGERFCSPVGSWRLFLSSVRSHDLLHHCLVSFLV
jgi:hypothetical protein